MYVRWTAIENRAAIQNGNHMLYHYTTPGGLLGIAKSKALWATHIQYLNDATEFLHAVNVARELTAAMNLNFGESKMFEVLLDRTHYQKFLELYDLSDDIFIACLSKNPDRLSQWRAYAGPNGYCIGFDEDSLAELAHLNDFDLERCRYDLGEQRELIAPVLEGARQRWREHPIDADFNDPKGPFRRVRDPDLSHHIMAFQSEFERVATVCKNPAFEEEEEWRLISRPSLGLVTRLLHFREGKKVLIPYTLFSLEPEREGERLSTNVVDVCCGPNPEPEVAAKTLYKLFQACRWKHVRITHSKVPHRDW
jgi:hypothetical protein